MITEKYSTGTSKREATVIALCRRAWSLANSIARQQVERDEDWFSPSKHSERISHLSDEVTKSQRIAANAALERAGRKAGASFEIVDLISQVGEPAAQAKSSQRGPQIELKLELQHSQLFFEGLESIIEIIIDELMTEENMGARRNHEHKK